MVVVVDGSHGDGDYCGAGLVLVKGGPLGEVVDSTYCVFRCSCSGEAERQAIIRGAAWAPGVVVYSDNKSVSTSSQTMNRAVRYLRHRPGWGRGKAHQLAHRLSVKGRLHASRIIERMESM